MKTAVVLAAGKGVRMIPITNTTPKPLININGKPFLSYLLDHLQQAGISRFVVVVGHLKEKMQEYFESFGEQAILIDQGAPKGTGHALLAAQRAVGKEPFLVAGGDNLWSARDIKAMCKKDNYCYLAATEVPDPQRYGSLVVKGDYLVQIAEKSAFPPSNLVNTGLYRMIPAIFDALEAVKPSPRGEIELTDALTALAARKMVKIRRLQDYWLDLGRPEDIPKIEGFLR